jgi:hypothetical protein
MDGVLQSSIVRIFVLREVHRQRLRLRGRVLQGYVGGEGCEFGGGAGDEEDVVAGVGELEGEFLANSIGGAGDDGPGAFGAEFAELDALWLGRLARRRGGESLLIFLEERIGLGGVVGNWKRNRRHSRSR